MMEHSSPFPDVQLTISGFDGSTKIASLVQAFESLALDVTLPALKTNLLNSATLESGCSLSITLPLC